MKNLWIGVNKLVRKVPIKLLHHAKFITSRKVSHLCNQHNYRCAWYSSGVEVVHLNKLTWQVFLLILLPYRVSVLLLTSGCKLAPTQCRQSSRYKLAPAQYKHHYYLVPSQSRSRIQIKTKLMLFKPLFIIHGRDRG